jgi:hypothetical protein
MKMKFSKSRDAIHENKNVKTRKTADKTTHDSNRRLFKYPLLDSGSMG